MTAPRFVVHFSGLGQHYRLTESKRNTESILRWEVLIPNTKYPAQDSGLISPGHFYLPREEYKLYIDDVKLSHGSWITERKTKKRPRLPAKDNAEGKPCA